MAVLKKLGNLQELAGCTLVVARFTRGWDIASSKPCHGCHVKLLKMITRYGLAAVLYTPPSSSP
jgi:hypothetical protein